MKMTATDAELLQQFAREKAQDSFTTLVHRYVDLVYSAALRQAGSSQLAEEVSQSVFLDLARSAARLKQDTILAAWLYEVARRTAIDVVRREARQRQRERIATEMSALHESEPSWTDITPLVDEAMQALPEPDRTALLLRYFENQSLREVGLRLGISDDAAQKRVSRALDRLRASFAARGIVTGAASIATVLAANAVQTAPAGLAGGIIATVDAAAATLSTTSIAATSKAIAMTTLQKTLITAAVALSVGTALFQSHQAKFLARELKAASDRQAHLTSRIDQLYAERDNLAARLAALSNSQALSGSDLSELARLRNEAARQKSMLSPAQATTMDADAETWLSRVKQLKQKLAQNPSVGIPEFRYLSPEDWLDAARTELNTDEDVRHALSTLRNISEQHFATLLQSALSEYRARYQKQFPNELSELRPLFAADPGDDILQRWAILPASTLPAATQNLGTDQLVTQRAAVDPELDHRFALAPEGSVNMPGGISWFDDDGQLSRALKTAGDAYLAAHPGTIPNDPAELLTFAQNDDQRAILEKFLHTLKPGTKVHP